MVARIVGIVSGMRDVVHAWVLKSENEVDSDVGSVEGRVAVGVG